MRIFHGASFMGLVLLDFIVGFPESLCCFEKILVEDCLMFYMFGISAV